MTWDEATQLADAIAATPDAGAWHIGVAAAPDAQGYVVVARKHGQHDMHYLHTAEAFVALCDRV